MENKEHMEFILQKIAELIEGKNFSEAIELGQATLYKPNITDRDELIILIRKAQAEEEAIREKDLAEYKKLIEEATEEYNQKNYTDAQIILNSIYHYGHIIEDEKLTKLANKITCAIDMINYIEQASESLLENNPHSALNKIEYALQLSKDNSKSESFESEFEKPWKPYLIKFIEKTCPSACGHLYSRAKEIVDENYSYYERNSLVYIRDLLDEIVKESDREEKHTQYEFQADSLQDQEKYEEALSEYSYLLNATKNEYEKERLREKISISQQHIKQIKGPIKVVHVKGGWYIMNSEDHRLRYAYKNKTYVESFDVGETPITQKQWSDIMGDLPYSARQAPDRPILEVSWDQVQEFLKRLNEKYPKLTYRLPTEAEWEYLARGGIYMHNFKNYPKFSEKLINKHGNELLPNQLEIYFKRGNFIEWCQDRYKPNHKIVHFESDPLYKNTRVYREGKISVENLNKISQLRRNKASPSFSPRFITFRVVRVKVG